MIIENIEVGLINPYEKNAKIHLSEQIERVARSIDKFGWAQPLVVDKNNTLIIGHCRLAAAKSLGLETVPVIRMVDLSPDQVKTLRLADNKLNESDWDNKLAIEELKELSEEMRKLTGFDLDLLIEPNEQDDVIPDNAPTVCKLGDLWQLGRHRLLCGDATKPEDVSQLMNGQKADMVFTSPPYSDMRDYRNGKELSVEHLVSFINVAINYSDFFAINLGIQRVDGEVSQYWNKYIDVAKYCGLKLLSWNIWDRNNAQTIAQQTALFGIQHEWIFVFGNRKEIKRTVANKEPGKKHTSGNRETDGTMTLRTHETHDYKQLGTIFRSESNKSNKTGHPATFPVELPLEYIKACTEESCIIYEPFGGSGSTLIACEKTNRVCNMMELDEKYCDVIIKRFEDFTGLKAEKL